MTEDLDTLLTALYVLVDDHVVPAGRRRPGRPKKLTDAELVCLAVAQVLLGARSEHHWVRMCRVRLAHLFPYLPKQPGYHKRIKAAAPLICASMRYLATLCPSWTDELRLADATPIPCGTSRETVKRSALAGWANYGRCAAHSRWYWGVKLYLITTLEGMPVAWCLADPKLGEREVATELFAHARDIGSLRAKMVVLVDKGLAGREIERFCADELGVLLVHPDRRDARQRRWGDLKGMRQWTEAVYDTCKDQLDLERHGGRTPSGVFARIAQRLLALAAVIWRNWCTDAPAKRSLIAYDH
ncbi:IS982 family transposase [Nocardia sp. NPDC002869]|uniref:IS982 family transposase n=1 Tax=Nocardia sp. NPDC002869 TaxID=3161032 RepID=UPI00398D5659